MLGIPRGKLDKATSTSTSTSNPNSNAKCTDLIMIPQLTLVQLLVVLVLSPSLTPTSIANPYPSLDHYSNPNPGLDPNHYLNPNP